MKVFFVRYYRADDAAGSTPAASSRMPNSRQAELAALMREYESLRNKLIYLGEVSGSQADGPARYATDQEIVRDRKRMAELEKEIGELEGALAQSPGSTSPGIPRIWNIPHDRNPHFTGRDDLLNTLHNALIARHVSPRPVGEGAGGEAHGGEVIALTQALHGLGGIGKTQLAVEYAYRHQSEYDAVWWVRAEQPTTLASDYAALAVKLEPRLGEERDQRALVDYAREWLRQHTRWLLIFDNAEEPDTLREYLPRGGNGHVLITSRNPNWGRLANKFDVPTLEREASIGFLFKRTGQQDRQAANDLADELGDLPLALEQAAAYIEATGETLAGYLRLWREQRREILKRNKPSPDYDATIETTWNLSFEKVMEKSRTAADLLNLCAFFAPDDIPQDVIVNGAAHLPKRLSAIVTGGRKTEDGGRRKKRSPKRLSAVVTDRLQLNDALGVLQRYSLMEVKGEFLSVHRLVQVVMYDRLTDKQRKRWAEAGVKCVNDAFPFDSDEFQTWDVCARLLPHALAAGKYADALEVSGESTARLFNQAALYLQGRAEYQQARSLFERAIAIGERTLGPDHPSVAIRVNNLGLVLRDLAIGETVFGPDHPQVAIYVNNLGLVLDDLGELEKARAAYERALAIDEKAFGPEHPTVASVVNNLGTVLRDLGELDQARTAFERALAIDEKALGPNHPNVAIRLNNLGMLLAEMGDKENARAYLERAVKILTKVLGEDHPNTRTARENLEGLNE